jgi:threonyl-tRNA synthetase
MVAIDGSELYAPDGTLVASSSKQEILQNLNLFDIKSGESCLRFLLGAHKRDDGASRVTGATVFRAAERLKFLSRDGCVPGFYSVLPAGSLVEAIVSQFNREQLNRLRANEIQFPVVFDNSMQGMAELTESYETVGRMFRLGGGDSSLRLSYAADPGLFSLFRNKAIDSKRLPYTIFSPTPALRKWQKGELSSLHQSRQFLLQDVHTITPAVDAYERWLFHLSVVSKCTSWWFANDWCMFVDASTELLQKVPSIGGDCARTSGRWVVLNRTVGQSRYFAMRCGLMVDGGYDSLMMYNMQLDFENPERFNFKASDGNLAIIHGTALTGCARILPILLGRALLDKTPTIAFEIAPTQIALLPTSLEHESAVTVMGRELTEKGYRVSVEPAGQSVGKRVAKARSEWIPYLAVIGQQEIEGAGIVVRSLKDETSLSLEEFLNRTMDRLIPPLGATGGYEELPLTFR